MSQVNETPAEFEKRLLAEEEQDFKQIYEKSPEDVHAYFMEAYTGRFVNYVSKLSKNSLSRVLLKLVAKPTAADNIRHTSKEEKEAFILGEKLLQSKFLLTQHLTMLEIERAENEKNQQQGEKNG